LARVRNPRRNGSFAAANAAISTAPLAAAENAAQADHQKLMKIMQGRIAAARILQTFPAPTKLLQSFFLLQGHRHPHARKLSPFRKTEK
jgi:hypothetical protein